MSWTCQKTTKGTVCKHLNPNRARKCEVCGKLRPTRKKPAHMTALILDYQGYIALTGGEFCAICKRPPSGRRRLDRDHDHATGKPRALLCARCNRALVSWCTPVWLRSAADYLERHLAAVSLIVPGSQNKEQR